jgi:hypothetical protein
MDLKKLIKQLAALAGESGEELSKEATEAATALLNERDEALSQVEQKESAYVGLQRSLEKKNTALDAAKAELAELKEQADAVKGESGTLQRQLDMAVKERDALAIEKDQLTKAATQISAEKQMLELITDKFPELGKMRGTLKPGETAEATEQMLSQIAEAFQSTLDAKLSAALQGYVPGGNFTKGTGGGKPGTIDMDALERELGMKAGTSEYEPLYQQWLAAREAAGDPVKWPQPIMHNGFDPSTYR